MRMIQVRARYEQPIGHHQIPDSVLNHRWLWYRKTMTHFLLDQKEYCPQYTDNIEKIKL